jgi:hypothetical protein
VVEYVGLVVAEVADGVVSEVGIGEVECFEVGQSVKIKDFLE